MSTSSGGDPERLLSSALRAQASGNTTTGGNGSSTGAPASRSRKPRPRRLPVLRVLLFALVLGLLAGGIVGFLTLV